MTEKDWDIVTIENSWMELSVVPAIGGKMISLYDKRNEVQYLHQPSSILNQLKMPNYGDIFDQSFAFGFDECFPTIEPCVYSSEIGKIELPDHGELWCSFWEHEVEHNSIHLHMQGKKLNYDFYRTIILIGNKVEINYKVTNNERFPFEYLWSAHPLLNISSGDKIALSDDITEIRVHWASDPDWNDFWDKVPWPFLYKTKEETDFSVVPDSSMQFAAKLFTEKLSEGKAVLIKPQKEAKLVLDFDTDKIPYLGIWLCYGNWPETNYQEGDITIALEPCSGRPDSLNKACELEEANTIFPGKTDKWTLCLEIV